MTLQCCIRLCNEYYRPQSLLNLCRGKKHKVLTSDFNSQKLQTTWRKGEGVCVCAWKEYNKKVHTQKKAQGKLVPVPAFFSSGVKHSLVSKTGSLRWLTASLSLGFLFWVLLLLLPLGIALCHGIYDGQNEIADHDENHFLKDPGEPVLTLYTRSKQILN